MYFVNYYLDVFEKVVNEKVNKIIVLLIVLIVENYSSCSLILVYTIISDEFNSTC
jgi:hypothetical protein